MNMLFVIFGILFFIVLCVHFIFLNVGSFIGNVGYTNSILQNTIGILESILIFVLSAVLFSFESGFSKLYLFGIILIGVVLLIVSVFNLKGLFAEKNGSLITETLTSVHVYPATFVSLRRQFEGFADGTRRVFVLRGRDKNIVKRMENSNVNSLTVTYHSSNRRIDSISF